jgi:hypothetical protein
MNANAAHRARDLAQGFAGRALLASLLDDADLGDAPDSRAASAGGGDSVLRRRTVHPGSLLAKLIRRASGIDDARADGIAKVTKAEVAGGPAAGSRGDLVNGGSRHGAPEYTSNDLLLRLAQWAENAAFGREALPSSDRIAVGALERLAERIIQSPAVEWWWDTMDAGNQYAYTTGDPPFAGSTSSRPESRSEEIRSASVWWVEPDRPIAVRSSRMAAGTRIPVALLCPDEHSFLGRDDVSLWSVRAPRAARVYEITQAADWVNLLARYPQKISGSLKPDWKNWTSWTGDWVVPDWLGVGRDWDGVHLSVAGYLGVSYRTLSTPSGMGYLAGWNPDETVWLHPSKLDFARGPQLVPPQSREADDRKPYR